MEIKDRKCNNLSLELEVLLLTTDGILNARHQGLCLI